LSKYAATTGVDVDRSKREIERTLERYGADQFMYGWDQTGAVIGFRAHQRFIRITLPLPARESPEFAMTPTGRMRRSESATVEAWEQEVRRRWRALALVIKAKLEAVQSGISSFEDEFLAQTVLPNRRTVAECFQPQIDQAYETGDMPKGILSAVAGPDGQGEQ